MIENDQRRDENEGDLSQGSNEVERASPIKTKSKGAIKREKSRKIKKLMKERLGIDCLQMICDDYEDGGSDEDNNPAVVPALSKRQSSKIHLSITENHINDYRILMKEIGVDNADDGLGLSDAFLQKHGKAKKEELTDFQGMFSVRDLLGYGSFGVVL